MPTALHRPPLVVQQTRDGIYIAQRGEQRLGTFYAEDGGWWRVFDLHGRSKRLYERGGFEQVADRAFGQSR